MAMAFSLRTWFRLPEFSRRPVFAFVKKRSGPFPQGITLDSRRVYIVPTRIGVIYAVLLLLLLLGSINYGKSLGYVLTFLLTALGNVLIFATWKNLAGLTLHAAGCRPVFAGERARFAVTLSNTRAQPRYAIALTYAGEEHEVVNVAANASTLIHFEVPTVQRGWLDPGAFRVYTEFPANLFVAWSWLDLAQRCLVYPQPAARAELPPSVSAQSGDGALRGRGTEEFEGLRKFQQGDSWRRVSWKALARSERLYVKEFVGARPLSQWIEWQGLQVTDIEQRISVLARLVIDADARGESYGLRLPGNEIAPNTGNAHFHQCMQALALYGK
jgi:uncharacterized protein (DUF58 family)